MSRFIIFDPEDQTYLTPRRPAAPRSYEATRMWSENLDDADSWKTHNVASQVRNRECPHAHILPVSYTITGEPV